MYSHGRPADWTPPAKWKNPRRWWGIRHARFAYHLLRFRQEERRILRETGDRGCVPYGDLEAIYAVRRGEWFT
jgi:hypothetical protein